MLTWMYDAPSTRTWALGDSDRRREARVSAHEARWVDVPSDVVRMRETHLDLVDHASDDLLDELLGFERRKGLAALRFAIALLRSNDLSHLGCHVLGLAQTAQHSRHRALYQLWINRTSRVLFLSESHTLPTIASVCRVILAGLLMCPPSTSSSVSSEGALFSP